MSLRNELCKILKGLELATEWKSIFQFLTAHMFYFPCSNLVIQKKSGNKVNHIS